MADVKAKLLTTCTPKVKPRIPMARMPIAWPANSRPLTGEMRLAQNLLLGGFKELKRHVENGCQDEAAVDNLIQWLLTATWVHELTNRHPDQIRTAINRILNSVQRRGKSK